MKINARAVLVLPWFVLVALTVRRRAVPRLLPVDRRARGRRDRGGPERVGRRAHPAPRPRRGRARVFGRPRRRRSRRGDGRVREPRRSSPRSVGRGLSAGVLLAGSQVSPYGRAATRAAGAAVHDRGARGPRPQRRPSSRGRGLADAGGGRVARLFGPPLLALARSARRARSGRDGDEQLRLRLHQAGCVRGRGRGVPGAAVWARPCCSPPSAPSPGVVLQQLALTLGLRRPAAPCTAPPASRGRLDRAIADRRERIRLELYTVNQLLAINLRTGAGPLQATQRIVDRGTGAMVEELDEVLAWVRSGVAEHEAFERAAELTPEPGAARTYKLIATGAERGVDLGRALRALSEDLRDARREEIAQDRDEATRRDARPDDRDARPGDAAVHRRPTAFDHLRRSLTDRSRPATPTERRDMFETDRASRSRGGGGAAAPRRGRHDDGRAARQRGARDRGAGRDLGRAADARSRRRRLDPRPAPGLTDAPARRRAEAGMTTVQYVAATSRSRCSCS